MNTPKVRFMLTCLCDAFYGEVGIAAVRILRAAGCEVEFPERQTCCGQPPFNSGDWSSARSIASEFLSCFPPGDPIVTPSASCAAMVREGYPMLLGPREQAPVYELGEFLASQVPPERWPWRGGRAEEVGRLAYHPSCHGRSLGLGDEHLRLLAAVANLDLIELPGHEQCCGFGGAFAATHPTVSAGIGAEKLRVAIEAGADTLVSGDMGCIMHLTGLIRREGLPLKARHYAEILAEALPQ